MSKEKVVYINYFDAIDRTRIKHLMAIINNVAAKENPDTLYFFFSSNGGEVIAGVTFYNFLKALPLKIITHNTGSIDSIANVVFVAGKERYASPHATFLFHGVTMPVNSPIRLSSPQINEIRSRINQDHDTIAGILRDETKMEEREIKNLFSQGDTKNTAFALEKGIINKVKLAEVPKGALLISVNINP